MSGLTTVPQYRCVINPTLDHGWPWHICCAHPLVPKGALWCWHLGWWAPSRNTLQQIGEGPQSSCRLQSERSLTELRPGPKDRLLAGNLASTVQNTSTQPIVMTHLWPINSRMPASLSLRISPASHATCLRWAAWNRGQNLASDCMSRSGLASLDSWQAGACAFPRQQIKGCPNETRTHPRQRTCHSSSKTCCKSWLAKYLSTASVEMRAVFVSSWSFLGIPVSWHIGWPLWIDVWNSFRSWVWERVCCPTPSPGYSSEAGVDLHCPSAFMIFIEFSMLQGNFLQPCSSDWTAGTCKVNGDLGLPAQAAQNGLRKSESRRFPCWSTKILSAWKSVKDICGEIGKHNCRGREKLMFYWQISTFLLVITIPNLHITSLPH